MSSCTALATKAELTGYATKSEVRSLEAKIAQLEAQLNQKANKSDLSAYALKSDLNSKLDISEKPSIMAEIGKVGGVAAFGVTLGQKGIDLGELASLKAGNAFAKANEAGRVAHNALELGTSAKSVANNAANVANGASGVANTANGTANAAKGIADKAWFKALAVAAQVASLLASLASLAVSVATLMTLGSRIDAVERYVDAVNGIANKAITLGLQALGIGRDAQTKVNALIPKVDNVITKVLEVGGVAYKALTGVEFLTPKLIRIEAKLPSVESTAKKALTGVETLTPKVTNLETKLPTIEIATKTAQRSADRAQQTAEEALRKANIPGRNGRDGRDGKNGADGKPGITTVITLPGAPGAAGRDGASGMPGKDGRPGRDGKNGRDGKDVDPEIARQLHQRVTNLENENDMNNELLRQTYQKTVETNEKANETNENVKYYGGLQVRQSTGITPEQAKQLDRIEDQTRKTNTGITAQQGLAEQLYQQGKLTFDKVIELFPKIENIPDNIRREFKPQLDQLPQRVVDTVTPALTGAIAPALTQIAPQVADAVTRSPVLGGGSNTKLSDQIATKIKPIIDNVPTATALLIPGILIGSQPFTQKMTDVATTGNCRSAAPGGCTSTTINNAIQNINANTNNKINKLDAANAGMNAAELLLLNQVNNKLGGQLVGGIGGFLTTAFRATRLDKIINLLTLITSLHNAAMLSRNLGQTLGDLTGQALTVIGIKDENGGALDINAEIGRQVNNLMSTLLGAETWQGTKVAWNKANTIIATTTQITNTVRSLWDSSRQIMEWTAENTGKIGNALKKFRVVGENAYRYMPEQVTHTNAWAIKVDRFRAGTDSLDDAASSLASVLGEVQNIQQEWGELKEQKEKFDKSIKDIAPKTREENKPVADAVKAARNASKAPANAADVFRGEGESNNA